ncbi:hypothetical protein PJE062_4793 [Pseudovibrio sp. JE062]|nr:hypothetical protein PJE062_4793 [Pseudovibrio sp. JE062]
MKTSARVLKKPISSLGSQNAGLRARGARPQTSRTLMKGCARVDSAYSRKVESGFRIRIRKIKV